MAAPEQRAGEQSSRRAPGSPGRARPGDEVPVDAAHAVVLVEVGGVLLPVGAAVLGEQPAGCGRARDPAGRRRPVAVADVRAVRVALHVGVGVVLAVVGHPGDHRALHGHRAEHGEEVLGRLVGAEGAVGEHAVEADRDAAAVTTYIDGQDRQVVPAHDPVPEEDDRGQRGQEGHDHGAEVRELRRLESWYGHVLGKTAPQELVSNANYLASVSCHPNDKNPQAEPWRALPAELADAIEPELPAATEEILPTIAREVPEYARPAGGRFRRGIRTGVTEALRQFVALIRDPDAGRDPGRDVYVALGRGELREGRTLDSLQSAYRVGARVAWRRVPRPPGVAAVEPEQLGLLAEAIFAYIDELSADSVEGYARHSASRRASASAAAASFWPCCSAIRRPPRSPTSAPPRRPRAGGCPAASPRWPWRGRPDPRSATALSRRARRLRGRRRLRPRPRFGRGEARWRQRPRSSARRSGRRCPAPSCPAPGRSPRRPCAPLRPARSRPMG